MQAYTVKLDFTTFLGKLLGLFFLDRGWGGH